MNQVWIAGIASQYDNVRLSQRLYEYSDIETVIEGCRRTLASGQSLPLLSTMVLGLSRIVFAKTRILNRQVSEEQTAFVTSFTKGGGGGGNQGGVSILANSCDNRKRSLSFTSPPTPGNTTRKVRKVLAYGEPQERVSMRMVIPDWPALSTKMSIELFTTGTNLFTQPARRKISAKLSYLFTKAMMRSRRQRKATCDNSGGSQCVDFPLGGDHLSDDCPPTIKNKRDGDKAMFMDITVDSISSQDLYFWQQSQVESFVDHQPMISSKDSIKSIQFSPIHFVSKSTATPVEGGTIGTQLCRTLYRRTLPIDSVFQRVAPTTTKLIRKQEAATYFMLLLQMAKQNRIQINQKPIDPRSLTTDRQHLTPPEIYCTLL